MPDSNFIPKTDAERLFSLRKSRDNILTVIESVTAEPKPTYNIDGQSVKWGEYLKQLQDSLASIEEMISAADTDQYGEFMSSMYT